MELGKIYSDVSVNEFSVKRNDGSFSVFFEFNCSGELVSATLSGIRDPHNLCEILNADRLWVEKEGNSQVEFGSYKLGISHEYFTEVVFDQLS
jgi:hypothetical protein